MSHPYTTRARTEFASKDEARVRALLDQSQEGSEYAGCYADVIERAANAVDSDLGVRYVVPFAAITDVPPCPGIISDLADFKALSFLYPADSLEAVNFETRYATTVARIIARAATVPGAAELSADASAAPVAISTSYATPTFAGVSSCGTRRTRGMF